MKLRITLKDPDGVNDALQVAADASTITLEGLSDSERNMIVKARLDQLVEKCCAWITYCEYVTIEIDTDAGTATVCKNS